MIWPQNSLQTASDQQSRWRYVHTRGLLRPWSGWWAIWCDLVCTTKGFPQVCLRLNGSMPDVGSSRITTCDPPQNAIPTDNARFCPPDSVPASDLRLGSKSRSFTNLLISDLISLKTDERWRGVRNIILIMTLMFIDHYLQWIPWKWRKSKCALQ